MATDQGLERYLLDGERVILAIHQHWAKVSGPVALTVGGLGVALFVDARTPQRLGVVTDVVWIGWLILLLWTTWQVLQWRHDWLVATDKRLLLTFGLVSHRVAMMPLAKVTDMSYQRSVPGRIFGYGQFIMESAGQDQALHDIPWIPDPDHTYRAICAEIFGVEDRDRVLLPVDDGVGSDDLDDGLLVRVSRWPVVGRPRAARARKAASSPPAVRSAVEEYGAHSRAIPVQHPHPHRDADADPDPEPESLYRSEDLRRGGRSGDTGPIPLYPAPPGD